MQDLLSSWLDAVVVMNEAEAVLEHVGDEACLVR
jgi:hypothetical protein